MAIDFTTGDFVVINRAFVDKILPTLSCSCKFQALEVLGYIGANPSEVMATGNLGAPMNKSYIKILPSDITNPAYQGGVGVNVFFCSDAHLNNSIEHSTAFIDDKCFIKAQNVSGGVIPKGALVYQVGFDNTLQVATVDLASASAAVSCVVLGLVAADIEIAECGSVLISGSFVGLDTSAFSTIGQTAFLSDTPGEISVTAGTTKKVVARVSSISATVGTIIIDSSTAGSGVGGFFTDGTGTDAAIGRGATAPTAAGDNALAQGNFAIASGDNSFAQGNYATAGGANSFAQGDTVNVTGDYSFAQGEDITVASDYSFAQGYDNETNSVADQSMLQGYSNYTETPQTLVQGYSNTSYGFDGLNNIVQGSDNIASYAYNCFVQGRDNKAYGNTGRYSFQTFAQGSYNYVNYSSNCFAQGYYNQVDGVYQENNFLQGDTNTTNASWGFLQGEENDVYSNYCMAQGYGNSVYAESSFAQGYNNTIGTGYGSLFTQGYNNDADGTNNFAQGTSNETDGSQVFVHGFSNIWGGSGLQNCFAQGYNNDFTGGTNAYQIMVQGQNNTVGGECRNVFIQGESNTTAFQALERVFVQGSYAEIRRSDQKVWGSNRTTPVGGAQSSRQIKWLATTDATPDDLAAVTTETDKTYALTCVVVARNTTTAAESASFVLSQATVYNDAGTSVLVGSPTFTGNDSGGGAATWAVALFISGADFRVRITGDSTDTVEWCCDLQYVEVAG